MFVRQKSIICPELVEVELLLLPPRSLHFPLLFVDGHIQYLGEVRDPLLLSGLDYIVHNRILELNRKLISVSLLFPSPLFPILNVRNVPGDNVIKCYRVVFVYKLDLNCINFFGEDGALLFDHAHLVPSDVEQSHRHLAPGVNVNFVLGDERVVIDDTSSVQPLENKLYAIVHCGIYLDHSVRDDLHDMRCLVNLENLGPFVKLGECH